MKKLILLIILMFSNSLFSEENDIDEKIKKFILDNPEILIQSLKNYSEDIEKKNKSQIEQKINNYNSEIFDQNTKMYLGDNDAKITITEFFDYNCSYCLKAHQEMNEMLSEKANFKVILKHLPILSKSSEKFARLGIVLASRSRDEFLEFHEFTIKNAFSLKERNLRDYFEKKKIDYNKLLNESENDNITKLIERDIFIAKELEINGTPAFVINDEILTGWIGKSSLRQLIDQQ